MRTLRTRRVHRSASRRRGASLVLVVLTVVALATLSIGFLTLGLARSSEQRGMKQELAALYVAQAGLSDAWVALESGDSGNLGSAAARVPFGGSAYWVERSQISSSLVSLISSGIAHGQGARVELVLTRESDSIYSWGVFGANQVSLSSNARLDAYDSSLGSYQDQAVNGQGSNMYALDTCTTGSNGNISLSQNATVYGDLVPGPESTATVLGNAVVTGSTTSATTVTPLPELEVPEFTSVGDKTLLATTTFDLSSGDVQYDKLRLGMNSTLKVTGPARIVCHDLVLGAGSKIVVDATNGPVEIYSKRDFVMNAGSTIGSLTKTPADVNIFLAGDNTVGETNLNFGDIVLDSNCKIWGTIFAPYALVDLRSNFELFGSLVAKAVAISSNALVHFDTDIAYGAGANVTYTRVLWRRLPFRAE